MRDKNLAKVAAEHETRVKNATMTYDNNNRRGSKKDKKIERDDTLRHTDKKTEC
jgi:hypothetical protein